MLPEQVIDPAHEYALINGGTIRFTKLDKDGTRTEGTTCEELIQICIHRLEHFQNGEYPCVENRVAIDALSAADNALQLRTIRRQKAGVEGTHAAIPD